MSKQKRPENTKKTLARLLSYMACYKFRLILVFFTMILGSICTVRGTYYLKPAINDFIIPLIGQKNPDLTSFLVILAKMAGFYLCAVFCAFLQNQIMVKISNKIMYRIRTDMFDRMLKMPLSYFDTHSTGKIMSFYTNDVDSMSNMLRQSFPKITDGTVTVVFTLVTIFIVNWKLALIVVACEAVLVFILKALVKRNIAHFANQQKGLGEVNGYSQEMIEALNVVKAFGKEEDVKGRFEKINSDLCRSATKANFYADSIFCVTNGLSNVGFTIIAVAGGLMSVYGMADVGTVGTFLQYYKSMYNPLTNISKQFNNLLSALAGAERIFSFIDTPSELDEGDVELAFENGSFAWRIPGNPQLVKFEGRIDFEHVDFGYTANQVILHDFNLSIKSGQKVAFVGSTGAGKTTVTNLFNRFYEISAGRILCDGIDIKKIKKDSLRTVMVMVLQDTHLFTGTISENIRFGRLDATQKEIEAAAVLANADGFIKAQSAGYDTVLTHDGSILSQGERQLLAIARSAVSRAPILILDEATSSIDTRTESLIEKGFDALMEGRTVLVIAHRLSTIKNADVIVVLDKGCIVEKGSHAELLNKKGMYYKLCSGISELQ